VCQPRLLFIDFGSLLTRRAGRDSYPGVACDIPAHVYQLTFESNSQWSSYYAPGSEIQAYLKRVATKYNVYKYVKFKHKVQKAEWDDSEGKWHVHVEDLITGKVSLLYSQWLELTMNTEYQSKDRRRHCRRRMLRNWDPEHLEVA